MQRVMLSLSESMASIQVQLACPGRACWVSTDVAQNNCLCTTMLPAFCVLQMIVGVLLFTPLLLLMPTTLVYYLLAVVCYGTVAVLSNMLEFTCNFLLRNPLYLIWCWVFSPGLLTGK